MGHIDFDTLGICQIPSIPEISQEQLQRKLLDLGKHKEVVREKQHNIQDILGSYPSQQHIEEDEIMFGPEHADSGAMVPDDDILG